MKGKGKNRVISTIMAVIILLTTGSITFTAYAGGETSGMCGDTAQYTIDSDGTLTVWGYGEIADQAFYCPNINQGELIKKIVIKEGITSIGQSAFRNNIKVVNVSLPSSLETIEREAFKGCTSLTAINLDKITTIEIGAFLSCVNLKNIGSFNSNKTVSISCEAFYNSGLENVYIPKNVKLLEGGSGSRGIFEECNKLQEVSINTKNIPSKAFYKCSNLSSVIFGDNVEAIGSYAFSFAGITELSVPANVSSMRESSFSNCKKMTNADLSKSGITTIGESCFLNCDKLEKIQLPKILEEIESASFENCTSLVSITIPASVRSIFNGEYGHAFSGCTNLEIMEVEEGNPFFYSMTSDGFKTNAIIAKSSESSENDSLIYGCKNTVVPQEVDIIRKAFCNMKIKELYINKGIKRIERDYSLYNAYDSLTDIWYAGSEEDWNEIPRKEIPEGQATIHYNWNGEIRRTVYFNPNSTDATVSTYKIENILSTQKIELPTPTWSGHKCIGWSIYPHATTAEYNCGELFTPEINVTLYAVWENNGGESTDPQPPVSETIVKESTEKNISCIYENGVFGTENDNELSMVVNEISVGTSEFTSFQTVITDGDPIAAYSIKIVDKDNNVCQPKNGESVTIKIKIPEGIKTTDTIFIYHKTNDGKTERIKMSDGNVKFENGYIVFKTTSFSSFVVVKESTDTPQTPSINKVQIDDISITYKSTATLNPIIIGTGDVEYDIKFESSNPKVVSVDENGKVTALKKGNADITVTVTDEYGNSLSDTCKVNVTYTWWQWIIKIVLFGWIWY